MENLQHPNTASPAETDSAPTATRHDLQLGRRLFHFSTGSVIATLYFLFWSHQEIVYFLGTCACLVYLFEQIRISYPEFSKHLISINRLFLRAEEQLKESASVPYVMGILLTILTFPKPFALIAVYTLAISDPLAGIVGIRFGKKEFAKNKTIAGSGAFFIATFFVSLVVVSKLLVFPLSIALALSFLIAFFVTLLELAPLRLDDNLTIPLYTAAIAWIVCKIASAI